MKRSLNAEVPALDEQMAQSMAELQAIMEGGQSPTSDGRLTVRTTCVAEPGQYDARAVKHVRESLRVSQGVFAALLGVSPVLVRSWERGVRKPAPIARRLLDQICQNPTRFISLIREVA